MAAALSGAPSRGLFALTVALLSFYLVAVPAAARRDGDFVHLWAAGRLVTEGRLTDLYDPVAQRQALELASPALAKKLWMARNDTLGLLFYPPPTALAYSALAWLPLRLAAGAAAVLAVATAGGAAVLLHRVAGGRLGVTATLALILSFPSFFYSYVLGQNGVYSLAAIAGAAALLLRGQALAGGAALGLLVLKPSWLLAMSWVPLVMGGRRAWLGMGLSAGALCGLSLIWMGIDPWRDFLAVLPGLAALDRAPGYQSDLQFNLLGLTRRALGVGRAANVLGLALGLGLVVATLVRARQLPPTRRLALAIVAASLCNPHLHHYDLLPPLIGLAVALALRPGPATLALLVAHHGAFVLVDALGISGSLPLPTFAGLALWLWLAFAREDNPTLTVPDK